MRSAYFSSTALCSGVSPNYISKITRLLLYNVTNISQLIVGSELIQLQINTHG